MSKPFNERYDVVDMGYTSPCWIWNMYTGRHGYGQLMRMGKQWLAHRFYFIELAGREVPEGTELDHLCKVKSCVNPDHLEAVPHAENSRRGPRATLCAAKADRIREVIQAAIDANPITVHGTKRRACPDGLQDQLAQEMGVSKSTVQLVWYRGTWQ